MMQDESAEIPVQGTVAKEVVVQTVPSYFSEDQSTEGPADEFRPVKISIVTTTRETRDEGYENEFRMDEDNERETNKEDGREGVESIEMPESPGEVVALADDLKEEGAQSVVSELGKSHDQETSPFEPEGEKGEQPVIEMNFTSGSKNVALFDASLLDEESDDESSDDDDLSVVSKSVVQESSKNVEEAEFLAKEMQRQLAESLEEYSKNPSVDEMEQETEEPREPSEPIEDETELPASSSSDSASEAYYSQHKILNLARSPSADITVSDHRIELPVSLPVSNSTAETESMSSSSSIGENSTATPHRRSRASFHNRRPSNASWNNVEEADSVTPQVTRHYQNRNITQQQQQILETVVIPAVFLIAAVAICRTFFHPWLKVGNDQSNVWALTWTILCILAVVAPVCALEYMLLGGLLAGTVVQEALVKYPEFKKFLKDVRRMRLKAGWWYPSEVRTLRKDLEATNAEILLNLQDASMKSSRDEEENDDRSLMRTMSREEQYREKAQLEKDFDNERSEWNATKEQLMVEATAEMETNAKLRDQLETEQQKQKQIAAQKEQLENNIEVERAQWKFARVSLEDALKTAVAAQKDDAKTNDFFIKMEEARDEERTLWEKARQGFQATIQQAEDDAVRIQQEHEGKIRQLDEIRASKQSEWDVERKSLKEAVKNALNEAKEAKDSLECKICQLMDENDADRARQIQSLKMQFIAEKKALEEMLEESRGEQSVSSKCVENLQTVLEAERAEWKEERIALEGKIRTTRSNLQQKNRATQEVGQNNSFKMSLQQELKSKESKIKALQVSIEQLENIISVQESVEGNNQKADREAANHYVKKVLESARAVLEAPESSDIFQDSLTNHVAVTVSAKVYVDELVSKEVGNAIPEVVEVYIEEDDDSEAIVVEVSNPWLRNAAMWQHLWSSLVNIKTDPKAAIRTICSGIVLGTGLGLGLSQMRKPLNSRW
jgi:hypothetical protein